MIKMHNIYSCFYTKSGYYLNFYEPRTRPFFMVFFFKSQQTYRMNFINKII